MVGSDVYKYLGDMVVTLADVLTPFTILYVPSTFTGIIISITRLFSSRPSPLCLYIYNIDVRFGARRLEWVRAVTGGSAQQTRARRQACTNKATCLLK